MARRLVISADSHVNEPLDLWERELPESLRDRAPRRVVEDDRSKMVMDGKVVHSIKNVSHEDERSRHSAEGNELRDSAGGNNLEDRLRDLELDGVAGEVIYPSIGLFVFLIEDPELQEACAQVYNDWAAKLFFERADVFAPAAILPARDLERARREFERVAGLGYKGAMLPIQTPPGAPYNSDGWTPLWEVAEEHRIPISYHVGTGSLPVSERGPGGAVINYVRVGAAGIDLVAFFAASGVLERHPGLHVAVVEAGAGWLPYVCERMDEAAIEHAGWVRPKLPMLPSEYVRRQVHVTLGADRSPILTREITGPEPLLWASDYPHPEGTFPESQQAIDRIFAGLDASNEEIEQIVGRSAAALWRLADVA